MVGPSMKDYPIRRRQRFLYEQDIIKKRLSFLDNYVKSMDLKI